MTLFFNTSSPNFKKKWEPVRKKGMSWFYARSAWRWVVFTLVVQACGFLARGRSFTWEDVGAAAAVSVLFGAVLPPVQWKLYERRYRDQVYGQKN